jgi:hypothetical protein
MTRSTPARFVPAAVEDHDFAACREMLEIALKVEHRSLAFGRCAERYDAEGAGTDPLDQALDETALTGRVAAFADDDHPAPVSRTQSCR